MRMLFVVDDSISKEDLLKQISQNFSKKKKNNLGHQVADQHSNSQLTLARKKKNLSKNGLIKEGVRKNPAPDASSLPSVSAAYQKNLPLSFSDFTSRNGTLRKIRGGRKMSVSSSEDDLDFENEDCDMEKQKRHQVTRKRKRKQCEILKEKLKESFLCSDKEENSVTMRAGCDENGREDLVKLSGSDMSAVKKKQKKLKRDIDNEDTGNEKHNSDVVEDASELSSFSLCDKLTDKQPIQSKSLNKNGITKDCHNGLNGQLICSLIEENNNIKSLSVSQTAGGKEYLIDSRRKNNSDYLNPKSKRKRKAETLQATNKKIKVEKLKSQDSVQTCRVTIEAEIGEVEYSICDVDEKNRLKTKKVTCRLRNDTQMSEKNKIFSRDEKNRLKNKKSTWDGESCLYLRNLFDQNKAIASGSGVEENDVPCDDGFENPDHLCDMESVQTYDSVSSVSDKQSSDGSHPVGIYIPDWVYVALDCEMVGVGPKGTRSVLARCSIVDYEGKVLYDEYVSPNETITDYRTRWSGIRPKHMSTAVPIDKALVEIEACLSDKIIIGHSVYHDFRVLGLKPKYYFVRDTAQCKQLVEMAGLEGRGNGLKKLSEALLDRHIQVGRQGHCSVEDARATLDLFKLVRKTWEPELYAKWMKKEPTLASKLTLKVEDARKNPGIVFEDFLQDEFWPCHVME